MVCNMTPCLWLGASSSYGSIDSSTSVFMVTQSCAVQQSTCRNVGTAGPAVRRHIPEDLLWESRMSQGVTALYIEVGCFPRVLPQDRHCVPRSALADRMLIVCNRISFLNNLASPPFLLIPRAPSFLPYCISCTWHCLCSRPVNTVRRFSTFRFLPFCTLHALLRPSSCFRNSVQNGWDACACGPTAVARVVSVTSRYVRYWPSGLWWAYFSGTCLLT
jgi:hypothetical protein